METLTRNHFTKYGIGVGTVLFITLGVLFMMKSEKTNHSNLDKTITIGISGRFAEEFTPEDISKISKYHVNDNLWGRLLLSNREGSLARRYDVSEDHLSYTFQLDPDAKFSDGSVLNAHDVKFTIDRLLKQESTGHAHVKSLFKSVQVLDEHQIRIEITRPTPSFLYLLSSPEFGILSPRLCDESGKLKSLKVTSGAYHLDSFDPENNSMILLKNKHFKLHRKDSPERAIIRFFLGAESRIEAIRSQSFDFMEIYTSFAQDVLNESKKDSNLDYKTTRPSLSTFVIAHDSALSLEQRRSLSNLFAKNYQVPDDSYGLTLPSQQLLPEKTFGSLRKHEIPESQSQSIDSLPKEIRIRAYGSKSDVAKRVKKLLTDHGVEVRYLEWKSKENAHLTLMIQGMNLDYPEIELFLATQGPHAFFELTDENSKKVRAAFHEIDSTRRAEMIKEVGHSLLEDAIIIPLQYHSYSHLYRNDRINIDHVTDYDGDIPIHEMSVIR